MADSADQQLVIEVLANIQDTIQKFTADLPNAIARGMKAAADAAQDGADKIKAVHDDVAKHAESKGEEVGENFAKGLQLAAAAGAAEFLNTMRETIEKASEYVENLGTLHILSGDSIADLQRFEFVMRGVGVGTNQTQQQLSQLQNRIEVAASKANDTSSIFYRLGISAKDMVGKTAIQNFEMVASRIRELGNATERTAAANDVFGARMGGKLLPILNLSGDAFKKAMQNADAMGAVLGDKTAEDLEKFAAAAKEAEQTTQRFFATLAGPVIPVLTALENATMHVEAAFDRLSKQQQLLALFGALGIAFVTFEKGLEAVGSFFAKSLMNRELITFLQDFAVPIKILIGLVTLLAVAWQTNFGNIRRVLEGVWNALQVFWSNAVQAFSEISKFLQSELGPAFARLSTAIGPLFAVLGALVQLILRSKTAWDLIIGAVKAFIVEITMIINFITIMINFIAQAADTFYYFATVGIEAFGKVEDAIAQTELALASFIDKTADAVSALPVVGNVVALALHKGAEFTRDQAVSTETTANDAARMAARMRAALAGDSPAKRKKKEEEKPEAPGDGKLLDASKSKDGTGDWLTQLKSGAADLKATLAELEGEGKRLEASLTLVGPIDSPKKAAQAQRSYTEQLRNSQAQQRTEIALQHEYERELAAVTARLNSTTDAKDRARLKDAQSGLRVDVSKTRTEEIQAQVEQNKLMRERASVLSTLYALEASNPNLTFLEREKLLNDALYEVEKNRFATAQDRAKAQQALVDAELADRAAASGETEANFAGRNIGIQGRIGARDQQIFSGARAPQEEQSRKVADSADQLTIAQNKQAVAALQAKDALDAYNLVVQKQPKDEAAITAAHTKLVTADNALSESTYATTQAQTALRNAQQATSPAVISVREGLAGLAQQVTGPLFSAFKMIEEGTNPLVAVFLQLFDKTRSFQDIMNVFSQIIRVVAALFDALRPVIDLFLGILIGVVNIFIALYNVVGSLLNLFGIHLVKLQALTESLGNLDTTVKPLVQVVHDLPTINEYNAGVLGNLSAEGANNSQPLVPAIENNTQSLVHLGTVLGDLIAVFAAAQIISHLGGFFQGLKQIGDSIAGFWDNLTAGWSQGMKTGVDDFLTGIGEIYAGLDLINNHTGGILGFLEKLLGYLSLFEGSINVINGLSNILTGKNLINGVPGSGGIMSLFNKNATPGSQAWAANNITDNVNIGGSDPGFGNNGYDPNSFTASTTEANGPIPYGIDYDPSGAASGGLDVIGDTGTTASGYTGPVQGEWSQYGNNSTGSSSAAMSSLSKIGINIGAGIAGNLLGGVLNKALGGNAQNASIGGSVLGAVGSIFGPLGTGVGSVVGQLIGGLFGPKYNATTNPDMYESTTNYTQVRDNMMGGTTMDAATKSGTSGAGDIKAIASYIAANGGVGLDPNLVKEFAGDTTETIMSLHQGNWTMANGVVAPWTQIVGDAQTALTQISQTLTNANMNLASTFGNGSAVDVGGRRTTMGQTNTGQASIIVNIDTLNSANASDIYDTMSGVMSDSYAKYAAAQQQTIRTNTFTYSEFV